MIRWHLGRPLLDFVAERKGERAPPPPDPNATAAAQMQVNRDAALYNAVLNRMDTYTPLGSQTYTQTGVDPRTGAPIYRQDIQLTPEAEQLYRQQLAQNLQLGDIAGSMMDRVQAAYGGPMDISGLPQLQGQIGQDLPGLPGADDLAGFRQQMQDALYDRNAAYLDPQFQRAEEALRTRLANQGVTEGSEAYRAAMDDFNRAKEMAYRQARNEAIIGGGGEAERMFGIGSAARGQLFGEQLSGGQFANQARAQGMSELFALRNQPLNEFNALRSASPVDMPQFAAPTPIMTNPADLMGAIYGSYQGQLNNWNARQQANNNLLSGLFSLGSAAILASDERVKEDIEPVGELNDGTQLYSFRYKGRPETHVGVMAQEVEKKDPKAVHTIGGVKHVDYARVLARALEAA